MTLAGHSRQLVRFEVPIKEPGLYHGFVEVAGGDDLPFDDRRWLAFRGSPPRSRARWSTASRARRSSATRPITSKRPYDSGCRATTRRRPRLLTSRRAFPGAVRASSLPDLSPFPRRRSLQRRGYLAGRRERPGALRRIGRELDHFHGRPGQAGGVCRSRASRALARAIARAGRDLDRTDSPTGSRNTRSSVRSPTLSTATCERSGFGRITRLQADPEARVLATASGGVAARGRENAGQGSVRDVCLPRRQRLGRLGHSSALCAAGPSIARLPDQPAAGDQSRAVRTRRRYAGASSRRHDRARPRLVRNVDTAESEIERITVAKLREPTGCPEGNASPRAEDEGRHSGNRGGAARRALADGCLGVTGRACRGNVCRQQDLCVIINRRRCHDRGVPRSRPDDQNCSGPTRGCRQRATGRLGSSRRPGKNGSDLSAGSS